MYLVTYFYSFGFRLVVVFHGPTSDFFRSFQHSRLLVPRFTVCTVGLRTCCHSMNSKSRLQCGRTSDIYPPFLSFHPLRYELYDSIVPNAVVMGRRGLAGSLALITSMGITQPDQYLPQGRVVTARCGGNRVACTLRATLIVDRFALKWLITLL